MDRFVVPLEYLNSTKNKKEEIVKTLDAIACPKFKEAIELISKASKLEYIEARQVIINIYVECDEDVRRNSFFEVSGIYGVCKYLLDKPSYTSQLWAEFKNK